ncbi:MAG: hypothetical protein U0T11_00385 [Chitinophagaceae bacterium]
MNDELLNILNDEQELSEEQLLNYINGNLSPDEQRMVEEQLNNAGFLSDAEEGLALIENKDAIPTTVANINRRLTQQLQSRRRRKRTPLPNMSLLILSTFLVLLLIVLAFIVISRMPS